MGLAEFVALAGQYGLWNAVAAVCVLASVMMLYAWSKTRNEVAKSGAAQDTVLTAAIGDLVKALSNGQTQAAQERSENLSTSKDMIGQMKGMTEMVTKSVLTSQSLSSHVHELSDMWKEEFPALKGDFQSVKTDLGAVKEKAGELQNSFTGALDARFEPVARLLNDVSTQVRDWDARQATYNNNILKSLDIILIYIKSVKPEETKVP